MIFIIFDGYIIEMNGLNKQLKRVDYYFSLRIYYFNMPY